MSGSGQTAPYSTDALAIAVLSLMNQLMGKLVSSGVLSQTEASQIANEALTDLRKAQNPHSAEVERLFRELWGPKP